MRMGRSLQIRTIVPVWLDSVLLEKGRFSADNNRRWIKPFAERHGATEIAAIGPRDLLAYRGELAETYAVGTVNQYVMTAKRLCLWSAENDYRKPIVLSGVRAVRDESER